VLDKVLLTPVEAARLLGIGRTKLYDLLQRGELHSVRLDGCRRVPRASIDAFVESLSRHPSTESPIASDSCRESA